MNHGGFPTAAAYSLAEIWQFPINGGGESGGVVGGGGGLELMRGIQFGESFGNDSVVLEHRKKVNNGCGVKNQRDEEKENEENESCGKGVSTSSANGMNDCDSKRLKASGSTDENHEPQAESEANSGKVAEQNTKPAEPPKQDYIHVRARRGQATDSHSLAERARREKISDRMKILQDLVPGCNKVIGKALVLDEIINYIQSLQHQVEFLSMKLEAVNTRMNPNVEAFPSKDFGHQTFDTAIMPFGAPATRDYGRASSSPAWLHMQIGGGFEKTT